MTIMEICKSPTKVLEHKYELGLEKILTDIVIYEKDIRNFILEIDDELYDDLIRDDFNRIKERHELGILPIDSYLVRFPKMEKEILSLIDKNEFVEAMRTIIGFHTRKMISFEAGMKWVKQLTHDKKVVDGIYDMASIMPESELDKTLLVFKICLEYDSLKTDHFRIKLQDSINEMRMAI